MTSINDVGWSTRAFNGLQSSTHLNGTWIDKEILTLEELAAHSREDIMRRQNVGRKTLLEYEKALADHGLTFTGTLVRWPDDRARPWFNFCL